MDNCEEEDLLFDKQLKGVLKEKRLTVPYRNKIRNLKQYKDLTDDEFDNLYAQKVLGTEPDRIFITRIEKKMQEFGESYDLSDLKVNDTMTLRSLAAAVVRMEDFENVMTQITHEGISDSNIIVIEKLGKIMSDLRGDISKMQDDLKITRKTRKGDKEISVIAYMEELKSKAKQFYESRMAYILCPKCNMLLGTAWFQYPTDKQTRITCICHRKLESGEICGTQVTVYAKDLLENRMSNKPEMLPETMK